MLLIKMYFYICIYKNFSNNIHQTQYHSVNIEIEHNIECYIFDM